MANASTSAASRALLLYEARQCWSLLTIFNLMLDTSKGGKPTRTGGDG